MCVFFLCVFFEQLNVTSPSAPALGSTAEVSPDHHDHGDEKQQQKPQQQSCHCPSWSLRRPCQWIYRGEGNASSKLILSLFKIIILIGTWSCKNSFLLSVKRYLMELIIIIFFFGKKKNIFSFRVKTPTTVVLALPQVTNQEA